MGHRVLGDGARTFAPAAAEGLPATLRINDDAHQWGLRFRAISGDPRRYGRVYIATDGRGLLYGDPATGNQE